jgi:CrcB protein
MNSLLTYLAIAVGSALGGLARFGCSQAAIALVGAAFPWGTIVINIVGSFVIGWFATMTDPGGVLRVGNITRQFVMVGICGGYTTFSSFSLETLVLLQRGHPLAALANVVLSLLLCLGGVWAGTGLAAATNKRD